MSRYDLEKAEALLEASEYNKQKEKDLIQNFKAVLKKRITND